MATPDAKALVGSPFAGVDVRVKGRTVEVWSLYRGTEQLVATMLPAAFEAWVDELLVLRDLVSAPAGPRALQPGQ